MTRTWIDVNVFKWKGWWFRLLLENYKILVWHEPRFGANNFIYIAWKIRNGSQMRVFKFDFWYFQKLVFKQIENFNAEKKT